MEDIPPYLLDGIRIADPERIAQALDAHDEGSLVDSVMAAREVLDTWAGDEDFWDSTAQNLPQDSLSQAGLEEILDEEQELLARAIGDRRLASAVLLDAPLRSRWPDPQQARQVVVILNVHCQEIIEEKPSRKRIWRAARVLRRVFKGVGGGLLVAADIVAPDPTLIVRVASIWGGVDLILDAVEME